MNTVIKRAWNKNKLVKVEDLTGMTFQAESGGHTFEISGVDDTGAAVSLSGTVEGRFLRADNAEIIISGTASDGKASVTLPATCYAIPGRFLLTIYVTSGGQKVSVYAATGSVVATSGTVGGSIPPLVTDSVQANTGTFGGINTGNATVDGVLDVTKRRSEATLSSQGWYKVCTLNFGSNSSVIGGSGFAIDLCITTTFVNSANDIHFVSLLVSYERYYFVDEKSVSLSVCIDKIRYVNDGNGNGHIDIHYSPSVSNLVSVDFVSHIKQESQQYIVAESLQSVADSPSGETVLTEYTFAANTLGPSIGQYSEAITSFSYEPGLGGYYHLFTATESSIGFKPRNVLAVFTDWAEGNNSVIGFTVQANDHLYVSFANNTPCTVCITYLK